MHRMVACQGVLHVSEPSGAKFLNCRYKLYRSGKQKETQSF